MLERIKRAMFGPERHYGGMVGDGIWLDCYAVSPAGKRTPLGPELSEEEYARLKSLCNERVGEFHKSAPNPTSP